MRLTHPESCSQDGDGHLLAAALVHQSPYDDVGVGVHVSLDDARRRVHLFRVGDVGQIYDRSNNLLYIRAGEEGNGRPVSTELCAARGGA